jgi:hypothetical protein
MQGERNLIVAQDGSMEWPNCFGQSLKGGYADMKCLGKPFSRNFFSDAMIYILSVYLSTSHDGETIPRSLTC